MDMRSGGKLNRLQQELPEGLLADAAWMEARGYSSALRSQYVRSGWLDNSARRVYHRALAEDVLRRASSRQYLYAACDVRACAGLAALLPEEDGLENHEAFMTRLRREHHRKVRFWPLIEPTLR